MQKNHVALQETNNKKNHVEKDQKTHRLMIYFFLVSRMKLSFYCIWKHEKTLILLFGGIKYLNMKGN